MKKLTLIVVLLMFASFVFPACNQGKPMKVNDQDIAATRALVDAWTRSSLAADWDAFGKIFATDAAIYPPNHAPVQGYDAVVAFGRAFPKLTTFTASVDEVNGVADLAYAVGKYAIDFTMPDGAKGSDSGSFIDIFHREVDGSWKISRAIWHSNAPPASPSKK